MSILTFHLTSKITPITVFVGSPEHVVYETSCYIFTLVIWHNSLSALASDLRPRQLAPTSALCFDSGTKTAISLPPDRCCCPDERERRPLDTPCHEPVWSVRDVPPTLSSGEVNSNYQTFKRQTPPSPAKPPKFITNKNNNLGTQTLLK